LDTPVVTPPGLEEVEVVAGTHRGGHNQGFREAPLIKHPLGLLLFHIKTPILIHQIQKLILPPSRIKNKVLMYQNSLLMSGFQGRSPYKPPPAVDRSTGRWAAEHAHMNPWRDPPLPCKTGF
jgi:hypothetical protein